MFYESWNSLLSTVCLGKGAEILPSTDRTEKDDDLQAITTTITYFNNIEIWFILSRQANHI